MEVFVLILVLGIPFAILWLFQFIQLMRLRDDLFPGRFDKCLWVAAFIGGFYLAPIAFVFWKPSSVGVGHWDLRGGST